MRTVAGPSGSNAPAAAGRWVAPMLPRFAGLTLAAAVLLSACSPLPTPKQEVKIGSEVIVGVPLAATGPQATEGTLTRQGYDLWADWANRDGGILIQGVKHPIRLVYEDDASRPDLSAQAAEKLITTEKAAFLLGPYGTTNSAAVAAVADRHHVPMMAANGAAHQLYTQGWRYLFASPLLTILMNIVTSTNLLVELKVPMGNMILTII